MIIELLKHASIRAPRYIKEMGYLKELISIESRFRRCSKSWSPHIQNTRHYIQNLCSDHDASNSKIILLGAGLLNDIPLAELSRQYKTVYLIDIFFMPSTRKYSAKLNNVRCVEYDVTNSIEYIYRQRSYPPYRKPEFPFALKPEDRVVSVNILSQLAVIPNIFLDLEYETENVQECVRRQICNHLELLGSLPCRVSIITDIMQGYYRQGENFHEEDMLHGVKLMDFGFQVQKEWEWDIAPAPEIARNISLRHHVVAASKV